MAFKRLKEESTLAKKVRELEERARELGISITPAANHVGGLVIEVDGVYFIHYEMDGSRQGSHDFPASLDGSLVLSDIHGNIIDE